MRRIVLAARESLLVRGRHDFSIAHERRRRIVVEGRDAENGRHAGTGASMSRSGDTADAIERASRSCASGVGCTSRSNRSARRSLSGSARRSGSGAIEPSMDFYNPEGRWRCINCGAQLPPFVHRFQGSF